MKVIVAGSRNFEDYALLSEELDKITGITEIISGGARGADSLGELYASQKGIPLSIYKADWETYGKSAGYRRNVTMASVGDMLVAFWDGESKGTKHMIDIASSKGLDVVIVLKGNENASKVSAANEWAPST